MIVLSIANTTTVLSDLANCWVSLTLHPTYFL